MINKDFLRCLVGFAEAGHRYNFAFFVHTLSLVDSSVVLSSSRCCNIIGKFIT